MHQTSHDAPYQPNHTPAPHTYPLVSGPESRSSPSPPDPLSHSHSSAARLSTVVYRQTRVSRPKRSILDHPEPLTNNYTSPNSYKSDYSRESILTREPASQRDRSDDRPVLHAYPGLWRNVYRARREKDVADAVAPAVV